MILFEDFRDQIINNEITQILSTQHKITTNNCCEFIKLLEHNTSIKTVHFPRNALNIESIKLLSEILKINTTITNLNLADSIFSNYEYCKLLTKAIGQNTSLTELHWMENNFGSDELKLVSDNIIKVNNSLKVVSIYFNRYIINNNAAIHLIDSLKLNKTLINVTIPMNLNNFHVCEYFAKFLRENDTICIYALLTGDNIDLNGIDLIIDALEYNPYVKIISGFLYKIPGLISKQIRRRYKRNNYNYGLRNMSILDIC
jgi:hypothetical protein